MLGYIIRKKIIKSINSVINIFDWHIELIKLPSSLYNDVGYMLNIGSGDWSSKGWTNLDYPSNWYNKAQQKHKIIPYDIRNDTIPFEDNSVECIYCSHVIEHIENIYVQKLFRECFRVLKKDGVFRIVCPDAEFLYHVSKYNTDYWKWQHEWFQSKAFDKNTPRNVDFLVGDIATPKLLFYIHSINKTDYIKPFQSMAMYDFFEYMTNNLQFRKDFPGDHINYWTFSKIKKMMDGIGYGYIIQSKYNGCCNQNMRNAVKFDTTHPQMSLYVDCIK